MQDYEKFGPGPATNTTRRVVVAGSANAAGTAAATTDAVSATGTPVALNALTCRAVTIVNNTGVPLRVGYIASASKFITVFDGSAFTFSVFANADELQVKTGDASTKSVEYYAEF